MPSSLDTAVARGMQDACEVALLERDLGRVVELVHEERRDLVPSETRPLGAGSEARLREMARENAGVVPEATDHRREARDAVLA